MTKKNLIILLIALIIYALVITSYHYFIGKESFLASLGFKIINGLLFLIIIMMINSIFKSLDGEPKTKVMRWVKKLVNKSAKKYD